MKLKKLWTLFTLLSLVFCWSQSLQALEYNWENTAQTQVADNPLYSFKNLSSLKSAELKPLTATSAESFLASVNHQFFLNSELSKLRLDFSKDFRHFRPIPRLPWPGAPPIS